MKKSAIQLAYLCSAPSSPAIEILTRDHTTGRGKPVCVYVCGSVVFDGIFTTLPACWVGKSETKMCHKHTHAHTFESRFCLVLVVVVVGDL